MATKTKADLLKECGQKGIQIDEKMTIAQLEELLSLNIGDEAPETSEMAITAPPAFDEEAYRKEVETKARIEAEAKIKVQKEVEDAERKKALAVVKNTPEAKAVQASRAIKVSFRNLENPKVQNGSDGELAFIYGGKRYVLLDGHEYDLPVAVVNHLNGLKYPSREYDPKAPDGEQVRIVGNVQRFSCVPVGPLV